MDSQVRQCQVASDQVAIQHLRDSITAGRYWYIVLLEAIGLWSSPGEEHQGRRYRYLIEGEAFDWLVLAERLCQTVNGLLPEEEKVALLFHSQPPLRLEAGEFARLIGRSKYSKYLNYFYGVTVEETLALAVQEEVRKERHSLGLSKDAQYHDEAYRRIYGSTRAELLRQFRQEKGYIQAEMASLTELKEFTYWLFKYRLRTSDKARVASDTKKALDYLKRQRADRPGFPV